MGLLYGCYSVLDHMLRVQRLQRWYFFSFFMHPLAILFSELYFASLRCLIFISGCPYKLSFLVWIWMSQTARAGMYQLVVIMGLDDASIIELYAFDFIEDEDEAGERRADAAAEEEDPYTSVTLYTNPRVVRRRRASTAMSFELPVPRSFHLAIDGDMLENSPRLVDLKFDVEESMFVFPIHHHCEEEEEEEGEQVEVDESERLVRKSGRGEERIVIESVVEAASVDRARPSSADQSAPARQQPDESEDEFYREYARSMRLLDSLMKERMYQISKLLGSGIQDVIGDMKTHMETFEWKFANSRLMMPIVMDLELGYVGQACRSWEALQKCYRRFEELAAERRRRAAYYDAADKFQQFHVRLDRFLENEKYDGRYYQAKRFWNYVHGRWPGDLLQVPQISEEEGNYSGSEESMSAAQVLETIKECIDSFSRFVHEDDMKSKPKLRNLICCDYSPVDDVNDLERWAALVDDTHKKEMELKKLKKGRRNWWNKRTASIDTYQRFETLFSMIDIKLVSRVLKMPCIPTVHLEWCAEKLRNVRLSEGRVVRFSSVSFFPIP